MKTRLWDSMAVASGLLLVAMVCPGLSDRAVAGEASKTKMLFVAGPCEHPPGTHEVAAGGRLE